jgi:hypothetical protein
MPNLNRNISADIVCSNIAVFIDLGDGKTAIAGAEIEDMNESAR